MADQEESGYYGSVVESGDQFGVWKKGKFLALSNFKVEFVDEVHAGPGTQPSGYVCRVTFRDGRLIGDAFVSCKACEERGRWINMLQRSLSFPSLKTNASNSQLGAYLMWKLETSAQDTPIPEKQIAKCTGLQDFAAETKMWLLNANLHIDEQGNVISPSNSPFIWLDEYIDPLLASTAVSKGKRKTPIKTLIQSLETCYQHNTPATLLTLGAQVLCLHFESLTKTAKLSVPATLLFGDVNCGKSKATKAALSLLGAQDSNFITSLSDSKARQLTSQTTLGIVIDDPTEPGGITAKILHNFAAGKATSHGGTYKARCTFISSLNQECLQKLASLPPRYISRVVLIPFVHKEGGKESLSPSERRKADMQLDIAIDGAGRCAPLMISLGDKMISDLSQLDEILDKLTPMMPADANQRLYISYGLLLFATFKLLGRVRLLEPFQERIWKFFGDVMIPAIKQYQMPSPTNTDVKSDIERILLSAVHGKSPRAVKSFLRIDGEKGDSTVCIHTGHLLKRLESSTTPCDPLISKKILTVFKGVAKGGVLKTFLTVDSPLTDIPKGQRGRAMEGAVYHRSIQLTSSALKPATYATLKLAYEGSEQETEKAEQLPMDSSNMSTTVPEACNDDAVNEGDKAFEDVSTSKEYPTGQDLSVDHEDWTNVSPLSSKEGENLSLNSQQYSPKATSTPKVEQAKSPTSSSRKKISPKKHVSPSRMHPYKRSARRFPFRSSFSPSARKILRSSPQAKRSLFKGLVPVRTDAELQVKTTHCPICSKKFKKADHPTMVGCDKCPRWFHMSCVENPDTEKFWECNFCN